jgi:hypothetical protein
LSQVLPRPARYGASACFEIMPSNPASQAFVNISSHRDRVRALRGGKGDFPVRGASDPSCAARRSMRSSRNPLRELHAHRAQYRAPLLTRQRSARKQLEEILMKDQTEQSENDGASDTEVDAAKPPPPKPPPLSSRRSSTSLPKLPPDHLHRQAESMFAATVETK